MAAPTKAVQAGQGRSLRRTAASRSTGSRSEAPSSAAPKYTSAAVVNGPRPAPARCTDGERVPNSAAAGKANTPPRKAGISMVFIQHDSRSPPGPGCDGLIPRLCTPAYRRPPRSLRSCSEFRRGAAPIDVGGRDCLLAARRAQFPFRIVLCPPGNLSCTSQEMPPPSPSKWARRGARRNGATGRLAQDLGAAERDLQQH